MTCKSTSVFFVHRYQLSLYDLYYVYLAPCCNIHSCAIKTILLYIRLVQCCNVQYIPVRPVRHIRMCLYNQCNIQYLCFYCPSLIDQYQRYTPVLYYQPLYDQHDQYSIALYVVLRIPS